MFANLIEKRKRWRQKKYGKKRVAKKEEEDVSKTDRERESDKLRKFTFSKWHLRP